MERSKNFEILSYKKDSNGNLKHAKGVAKDVILARAIMVMGGTVNIIDEPCRISNMDDNGNVEFTPISKLLEELKDKKEK